MSILLVLLLLALGVSYCGKNAAESTPAPTTVPATPATEPEEKPSDPTAGTQPSASVPTEPEKQEPLPSEPELPTEPKAPDEPDTPNEPDTPSEPEIPDVTPSEPETPAPKPQEPPKEEEPEPVKPAEPKPVEYIQGNGYKRVKDFDPATNTGQARWYISGNGVFYAYEDEFIFEVRPGELTYEMWCSWDIHAQVNFDLYCDWSGATIDDKYNFFRITEHKNYTCGWEGHYCYSESRHQSLLEESAKGCAYCGKTDCVSFYTRNVTGFTTTDIYSCPEYDARKDPMEYCEDCGYPKWGQANAGEIYCSKVWKLDLACGNCGEMMYMDQCHHCTVPADYVPVDAHFHVYIKQVTPPTCTKPGVVRYVCSCGDSSRGEEIPVIEHQYGDWVVVKEATPEEQGLQQMKCSLCAKTLSKPYWYCADNDDAEAIARLLIEYINDYRAEEGVAAAITMEQCTVYAKIRSQQMAAKGVAAHNVADAREAATQLRYGTYVDPAEYGLSGEPYYHVNASEAVGMNGGAAVETIAENFAEGFRNSAPHWSYVGSDPYIAVGLTMNSDGLWFCCIIASEENLDLQA